MSVEMPAQSDEALRNNSKDIALEESKNRTLRAQRLMKIIWLVSSLVAALFLGWSMIVGIWTNYREPFSIIGFLAAVGSTSTAAYFIFTRQTELAQHDNQLVHLYTQRAHLAAKNALNHEESLRIYRINARSAMDRYREQATRSRKVGNTLQWLIIIGAVIAASSTSASAATISDTNWFKWVAAAMSMIVAIASAATGFFKFRERGVAKQQTADSIARESQAMELGLHDYRGKNEVERLTLFAERVEEIVEEQRKRELQLEESSGEGDNREAR